VGDRLTDKNMLCCAFLSVNEYYTYSVLYTQECFHSAGAPMNLHLEQHRRDRNRFRFYARDVGQDLFGTRCLWRRWGRIGTDGRARIDSFGSEAAAVGAATALSARKQRRGYALLPEQLELPLWD